MDGKQIDQALSGELIFLKAAWRRALQLLGVLSVLSLALLPSYAPAAFFACSTVLQRLRLPVMGPRSYLQLAAAAAAWFSLRSYHGATQCSGAETLRGASLARHRKRKGGGVAAMTLTLWLGAVLLAGGPSRLVFCRQGGAWLHAYVQDVAMDDEP
eukprot:4269413-Amphidinium_carterae.1